MAVVCMVWMLVMGVGVTLYDARHPSTRNYAPLVASPWLVYFAWNAIRGYRSENYGALIVNLGMAALLVALTKTMKGRKEEDLLPALSGKGWVWEAWRRYRRRWMENAKTLRLRSPWFHLFVSMFVFGLATANAVFYVRDYDSRDAYYNWTMPLMMAVLLVWAVNEWVQLWRLRKVRHGR
jgi:hypothetical protein